MSTPTPSWYDLLGVAPDAPADEVRAAWRAQIADLDPTDRRFAVLNQAAEVLLDPDRRAAYDAELADHADLDSAPVAEPVAEPDDGRRTDPEPADVEATPSTPVDRVGAPRLALVPGWLLAGIAAVTLALVVAVAVLWVREPSAADVEGEARAAQAAAERAVVPILSYDATRLDESKAAAQQYLTGSLRTDYDNIFAGLIEKNAPATKTVVQASLVRSSIVRADGDRAQVFLLVNQTRTNKKYTEPQVYKNWVTLTMDKVDGEWLVADMTT
ncbi:MULTISPECIES: DnaJ domain-containing protein [unclassified Nocardioides]|uniref:J domain-containing protein n=1 Tax=unclassified Nocardioides TaxID=2615069 RepID=UPI0000571D6D|nr:MULTISPECIES: DnaJ domain-containing protein [unclassified Nocardioides]ABL80235.1 heat shock protein DnaJ domain protein [Nocardioides sp. JS614]MBI2246149.1 DnaJ domain-containing protein [Nocardioides sp.]